MVSRFFSRELDFIHDCTKSGKPTEKLKADQQMLRWKKMYSIDLRALRNIDASIRDFALRLSPFKDALLQLGKLLYEFMIKLRAVIEDLLPLFQPIIDFLDRDWLRELPRPWCGGEIPVPEFGSNVPSNFATWARSKVALPSYIIVYTRATTQLNSTLRAISCPSLLRGLKARLVLLSKALVYTRAIHHAEPDVCRSILQP